MFRAVQLVVVCFSGVHFKVRVCTEWTAKHSDGGNYIGKIGELLLSSSHEAAI